ncbi:MAG: tRNA pseudouridine(38-40) synthase TruA [Kyrpidia sp.]|nr:tRNA pseudouridine(38-40) synthase TruA [Kyrpidia sp.]
MNLRATVAYDGTDFHGFQRQPGLRTVQGVLEECLSGLAGRPVGIAGAGRTDAGVHARAQVITFEWSGPMPWSRLKRVLFHRLPGDVVVSEIEPAPPHFHARFSAVGKCYRYTVDRGAFPDVFSRRYALHEPRPLDLSAMAAGARELTGTHDYTSFCSSGTPAEDKVRTVHAIRLAEESPLVHLYVFGNGFLYQMVRILVGTLLEVGLGKRAPSSLRDVLEARDRRAAGITVPAKGLTLWEVYYAQADLNRALERFS